MKKYIVSFLVISVLLVCLCGCGSNDSFPEATEKFYVNDFADILDNNTETELFTKAAALDKATTAQVTVVTVKDLGGMASEEYALELGRKWGVGNKESNNGIVILLSKNDRDIYIAVGDGLSGALPDSKTGRIIDVYGLEYLKNDDFSKGILAIGNAVINEVYIEYDIEPEEGYIPIEQVPSESESSPLAVVICWLIMIAVFIALSRINRRFGGGMIFFSPGYRGSSSGSFFGGGSSGGFHGGGGSFSGGGAGRGF